MSYSPSPECSRPECKTIASQLRQLQSEIDAQRTWFINASSQREEQLEKDVQRAIRSGKILSENLQTELVRCSDSLDTVTKELSEALEFQKVERKKFLTKQHDMSAEMDDLKAQNLAQRQSSANLARLEALLIKKDHDVSLLTKRNDGLVTDLECLFALHEGVKHERDQLNAATLASERLTWRLEQEKAEMQEDLRTMRETLLCLEAGGARGQDSRPIEEQHFETPKPRLEESNQARRLDEELFEVDSEDESYGDLSETFQGLEERFGGEALHDDGYAPINPPYTADVGADANSRGAGHHRLINNDKAAFSYQMHRSDTIADTKDRTQCRTPALMSHADESVVPPAGGQTQAESQSSVMFNRPQTLVQTGPQSSQMSHSSVPLDEADSRFVLTSSPSRQQKSACDSINGTFEKARKAHHEVGMVRSKRQDSSDSDTEIGNDKHPTRRSRGETSCRIRNLDQILGYMSRGVTIGVIAVISEAEYIYVDGRTQERWIKLLLVDRSKQWAPRVDLFIRSPADMPLPSARPGDCVLLRSFSIREDRAGTPFLTNGTDCKGSAWCVWNESRQYEATSPPFVPTKHEKQEMRDLYSWWQSIQCV